MMLFKLAQWMEERTKLAASIQESQGDVRFLLHKKEQVEEQLRFHARQWLNGNGEKESVYDSPKGNWRETDIPGLWVVEPPDDIELTTRVL